MERLVSNLYLMLLVVIITVTTIIVTITIVIIIVTIIAIIIIIDKMGIIKARVKPFKRELIIIYYISFLPIFKLVIKTLNNSLK
jgi:hypothetical protein